MKKEKIQKYSKIRAFLCGIFTKHKNTAGQNGRTYCGRCGKRLA